MKKLITLVAAMIGFGAFAVDPVITGTGFETAAYTAGSALAVSNDDAGVEFGVGGYDGLVWEASKDLGEDAMVKAYDDESGKYTPSATYLTHHQVTGDNYLALDIGDARLDRYIANGAKNDEDVKDVSQEISATGFYIDTLVKFTAAEEPSWSAMQATDKLSITYIEHDADPTADPVDAGYTNFVVRAGFINEDDSGECTITPTEYKLSVPANFDKSAWHRLTVRAIKDVGYAPAPVGFVVYVGEEMLQYSSSTKISTDNVTFGPMGTRFYSDTVHALLPSLINDAVTGKNISKLGFSGTGSIDNIAFVQNVIPDFVVEETPVTLKWGDGFASITITPQGGTATSVEDLTDGEHAFNLPVGVTAFTVAVTYADGYEAAPWTMNGEEIKGTTFANVTPGAICELNAMQPNFNVIIGNTVTPFESLDDALEMVANADDDSTLKLVADCEADISLWKEVDKEGAIILDLAGKTITGAIGAPLTNGGVDLIITNSTQEVGRLVPAEESGEPAMWLAGGTTEIYGGKFCGAIDVDGAEWSSLSVFGGIFLDESATGAEDFYLAESLDPSVGEKVVGPDADGYFTVGEEPVIPEVKPFQVIIGDNAPVGFDSFDEALVAANEADAAAKIELGKDVTTDGKLTITGNVTIDLNGWTIAQNETVDNASGVLIVAHGGTLTIDDSSEPSTGKIDGGEKAYAAVAMTGKGDTADTNPATLVVNAGTLQGYYYGIVGNGNPGRGNTSVTIDGGVVKGLVENNCAGIYNPQGNSTVVINGGVVEGAVGIYAKAGTITVNGGEVKAVGAFVETPTFNGSGFEPCGDAIVLDSAAGYAGNVSLTLGDDATLTSANGFAVREAVTKGANTTLSIADAGATLTAPKGGLAVSDEFAEKLASGGATITGYTIAIDGVCGNDSLLAAIGKVTDGGTITLLADVPNATGITIDSKKTFTVDFNGFTYTVNKPGAGSTGTATQAFQLLKGQTITFKNGTINAAADNLVLAEAPAKNIKRFFQSYANLTLENMTLDGTNLYLNPADNAVCEFANGTVALTGSTSIDAPANCIAVSVDNWKKAYPDGVAVTINTTGTIDGVKVWTEGEGASTPAQLTLTAGTITALEVAGEDADFTVTKGEGATVTAPEGYEWDETTGELKKIEEPTGLTLMIAGQPYDAETNPYVIRDAADFAILQADVAKDGDSVYGSCKIVMTNDIDMADAGAWKGIGVRKGVAFKGVFDGQGHKVSNLTLAYGMTYNGLFGHTSGATVKNLTVEFDGFEAGEGGECGGAIIGRATEGLTLENVTAEGALSGNHKVAGLVVQVELGSGTIVDCTNKCAVTSKTAAGFVGIVGRGDSGSYTLSFVRCVNKGAIAGGSESAAAFIAYFQGMNSTTFDSCVNSAAVTGPANDTAVVVGSNHDDQGGYVIKNLSTFVTAASDTLLDAMSKIEVTGFTYAIVDDGDPAMATFVADNALAAGNTYELYAAATPAITLAEEGDSIAFNTNGFAIVDTGIKAGNGLDIEKSVSDETITFKAVPPPPFAVMIADVGLQKFDDIAAALTAAGDDVTKVLVLNGNVAALPAGYEFDEAAQGSYYSIKAINIPDTMWFAEGNLKARLAVDVPATDNSKLAYFARFDGDDYFVAAHGGGLADDTTSRGSAMYASVTELFTKGGCWSCEDFAINYGARMIDLVVPHNDAPANWGDYWTTKGVAVSTVRGIGILCGSSVPIEGAGKFTGVLLNDTKWTTENTALVTVGTTASDRMAFNAAGTYLYKVEGSTLVRYAVSGYNQETGKFDEVTDAVFTKDDSFSVALTSCRMFLVRTVGGKELIYVIGADKSPARAWVIDTTADTPAEQLLVSYDIPAETKGFYALSFSGLGEDTAMMYMHGALTGTAVFALTDDGLGVRNTHPIASGILPLSAYNALMMTIPGTEVEATSVNNQYPYSLAVSDDGTKAIFVTATKPNNYEMRTLVVGAPYMIPVTVAAGEGITSASIGSVTEVAPAGTVEIKIVANDVMDQYFVNGVEVTPVENVITWTAPGMDQPLSNTVLTVTAKKVPLFPRPGTTVILADQDGTAAHPWAIADEDDLQALQKAVAEGLEFADDCFIQIDDIDMTGINWTGIGTQANDGNAIHTVTPPPKYFAGVYNGNGFSINNLAFIEGKKYMGLFCQVYGAAISNLTVNVDWTTTASSSGAGAVVGWAYGPCMFENIKVTGSMTATHNCAGFVAATYNEKPGVDSFAWMVDGDMTFKNCTNEMDIVTTGGKAAAFICSNTYGYTKGANAPGTILFDGCVNTGDITANGTLSNNGVGIVIGYNSLAQQEVTIKFVNCDLGGSLNYADGTNPQHGVIMGSNNNYAGHIVGEGANVVRVAGEMLAGKENNVSDYVGFTYAIVDNDVATFVADSALAAGDTVYTLYADATPVITLAAEESITFDKKTFSLNDEGIKAGEGAEREAPVEEGTLVTYSAKAASTGPTIDDGEGEGTQVMIADDKTITNVNSTVAINLPEGWDISKNGEIFTIVDGKQEVWGNFPEYYDAAVKDGVVSIALNAKALCEMDLGTEQEPENPLTITEDSVSLAVKNIQDNLYYGLATKASLDAKEWTAPAEYILGSDLAKDPVLTAEKVADDAGFYVISVTDVPAK